MTEPVNSVRVLVSCNPSQFARRQQDRIITILQNALLVVWIQVCPILCDNNTMLTRLITGNGIYRVSQVDCFPLGNIHRRLVADKNIIRFVQAHRVRFLTWLYLICYCCRKPLPRLERTADLLLSYTAEINPYKKRPVSKMPTSRFFIFHSFFRRVYHTLHLNPLSHSQAPGLVAVSAVRLRLLSMNRLHRLQQPSLSLYRPSCRLPCKPCC